MRLPWAGSAGQGRGKGAALACMRHARPGRRLAAAGAGGRLHAGSRSVRRAPGTASAASSAMANAIAPRSPLHHSMTWCDCGMRSSRGRPRLTSAAQGQTLRARDTASATKHTPCAWAPPGRGRAMQSRGQPTILPHMRQAAGCGLHMASARSESPHQERQQLPVVEALAAHEDRGANVDKHKHLGQRGQQLEEGADLRGAAGVGVGGASRANITLVGQILRHRCLTCGCGTGLQGEARQRASPGPSCLLLYPSPAAPRPGSPCRGCLASCWAWRTPP